MQRRRPFGDGGLPRVIDLLSLRDIDIIAGDVELHELRLDMPVAADTIMVNPRIACKPPRDTLVAQPKVYSPVRQHLFSILHGRGALSPPREHVPETLGAIARAKVGERGVLRAVAAPARRRHLVARPPFFCLTYIHHRPDTVRPSLA